MCASPQNTSPPKSFMAGKTLERIEMNFLQLTNSVTASFLVHLSTWTCHKFCTDSCNNEKVIFMSIVVDDRAQRIEFPFSINYEFDLQDNEKHFKYQVR